MPRTLQQSVVLPASPARLYAMYLDPKTHAAITGEPARIGHSVVPPSVHSAVR